jgi:hypothetical protein
MMRTTNLAIAGLCLVAAITATNSEALAQGGIPNCDDLPNPIFMSGTTAVLPVIRNFGAKLKKVGVTLLWNENSEGCGSVQALAFPQSGVAGRPIFSQYDEDPTGATGKVVISTCLAKSGQLPELVINDTYWKSCTAAQGSSANLPATLKEFSGPVQGLVPIVTGSYLYYSEITIQELQDLYMCGAKGKILNFSNTATIYDYNCYTSGMRELWARGLGLANGSALPGAVGEGCYTNVNAETMVTTYVAPTIAPDTTIGYTSTEFYDENRDKVRAFKVRGVNQLKAYLPDTDLTSTDKINIREGRYTIQGALKLVATVDANGVPISAGAKKIIDWLLDNPLSDPSLTLPFDLNEIYAQHGVVPQCAMRVTKGADEPVFRHYRHLMPCHCSFEMLATGKTSPGCSRCADSSTCGAKICSHGYCE